MTRIAVVAIGRNEGARLLRCLDSLQGQVAQLVYVDSGSRDGSVAAARARGAEVVELDMSTPFTAARARHEGYLAVDPAIEIIQFVDGDCGVEPGWIAAGQAELARDPALGLVTGWRSEIAPDASVYNALCDFEWHRPAGDIVTCGGDMMVRRAAYEAAGGFNGTVIAAEDDEFCVRLGKAGWGLRRLPLAMTRHDAAMTRFGEWWRRAVRSGHGFAQVGHMHPDYFVTERRRVLVYGGVLPVLAVLSLFVGLWLLIPVLGLYGVSYLRTVKGLQREGMDRQTALHHGVFLALSKIPNMIGMMMFGWRRLRGSSMRIIEYK